MRILKALTLTGSLAAAGLFGSLTPASATVIDFQNLPAGQCSGVGPSAASGGFTFTAATNGNWIYACDLGALAQNTSRAIVSANDLGTITFAPTAGGMFSLNGFDAGTRTAGFNVNAADFQSSTGILVEGLSGGNVVASTSFTFNGFSFSTFALSSAFSNLTSVRITPTGPNDLREFVLDNVRVNEAFTAAVPEPATWAMMIMGFGLMGASLRSRKAKVAFA